MAIPSTYASFDNLSVESNSTRYGVNYGETDLTSPEEVQFDDANFMYDKANIGRYKGLAQTSYAGSIVTVDKYYSESYGVIFIDARSSWNNEIESFESLTVEVTYREYTYLFDLPLWYSIKTETFTIKSELATVYDP